MQKKNVRHCFKRFYGSYANFVLCDNSTYVTNNNDQKVKYNRTLNDEALNKFEKDLSHTNWETVLNECNPNLAYLQFMQILSNTMLVLSK